MQKLLQVNRNTGIKERPNIIAHDDPLFNRSATPTISEIDHIFRTRGVDLAVRACRKAIADWGSTASQITHTVAATGTNAGSPGYDLLVNGKLGVPAEAARMLLSGVGCAGGLAALRAAATIANDATLRGRPARVLGLACDLTSTNIRCDLAILAEHPEETRVSMALFSDAAAAFVVCNGLALEDEEGIVYSVLDWESGVLKGTQGHEQCVVDPLGKYDEPEQDGNADRCRFPVVYEPGAPTHHKRGSRAVAGKITREKRVATSGWRSATGHGPRLGGTPGRPGRARQGARELEARGRPDEGGL